MASTITISSSDAAASSIDAISTSSPETLVSSAPSAALTLASSAPSAALTVASSSRPASTVRMSTIASSTPQLALAAQELRIASGSDDDDHSFDRDTSQRSRSPSGIDSDADLELIAAETNAAISAARADAMRVTLLRAQRSSARTSQASRASAASSASHGVRSRGETQPRSRGGASTNGPRTAGRRPPRRIMEDELHEPILPVQAPVAASVSDLGRSFMDNFFWHVKADEPPVELPTPAELGENEEKRMMQTTIQNLQRQLAQVEANRESVEATPVPHSEPMSTTTYATPRSSTPPGLELPRREVSPPTPMLAVAPALVSAPTGRRVRSTSRSTSAPRLRVHAGRSSTVTMIELQPQETAGGDGGDDPAPSQPPPVSEKKKQQRKVHKARRTTSGDPGDDLSLIHI